MVEHDFSYAGLTAETAYELQRKNLVAVSHDTMESLLKKVTSFKHEKPFKLTAANYPTGFTLEMAYNVRVKFEFQKGMEFGVDIERSADNESAVIYLLRLK